MFTELASMIFDSGNETLDPCYLEHLQGMETARSAWLAVNSKTQESIMRAKQSAGSFQIGCRGGFVETW